MNLQIRKAVCIDIPFILEILNEASEYKLERKDKSWNSGIWNEEEIINPLKAQELYVAEVDEQILACAILEWSDEHMWPTQAPNAGYLHKLAVKNDFHGKRIGSQLFEYLLLKVKEHDRQYLRLDCDSANISLCKYYEAQGFRQSRIKQLPPYKTPTVLYERLVNKHGTDNKK